MDFLGHVQSQVAEVLFGLAKTSKDTKPSMEFPAGRLHFMPNIYQLSL